MAGHSRILVTGATGNVGRQLVSRLLGMDATVRALVHNPANADLPAGVEVVHGDLTDPDSLHAALDGVGSVFLLWPFLTAEGAPAVVDVVARQASRIVYLSAMNVQDDREPQANGVWGQVEDLIRRSGLDWTFLRAGGLAVNTLAWAGQIRARGVVRWPYGEAARSLVHERDIAAVAARALTEEGHVGARYVLTGPEAVTQARQAAVIGDVVGRPVRWEEPAPEAARRQLLAALGDPGFVDGALAYWATLVAAPEPVTSTVEEVTGAPARIFREWAQDHVDDFRRLSAAEVADRYVSSFRTGRIDAALGLLSADMVRVAPLEAAGGPTGQPAEARGVEAIMENSRQLNADIEIHGVEIDGPFLDRDRFAVRFAFEETHVPTGGRRTTAKMSLYTVADSAITREEVYYLDAPDPPGRRVAARLRG